jgi:hypothetical protein
MSVAYETLCQTTGNRSPLLVFCTNEASVFAPHVESHSQDINFLNALNIKIFLDTEIPFARIA